MYADGLSRLRINSWIRLARSPTDDGEAQETLNAFLRSRRVLNLERVFARTGWSFCVEWLEGGRIQTVTGRVYYVESCLPGDTSWKPVTGLIGGQVGVTPWLVARPTEAKTGFYRAVLGVPSDMTKVVP